MVWRLDAALLVAALQAASCRALAPAQSRAASRGESFELDDRCFLFVKPPLGREVGSKVPCVVTSLKPNRGRYNVSLLIAPRAVELLMVPVHVLQKAAPKEYLAVAKDYASNLTRATLAARLATADHAKWTWRAEQLLAGGVSKAAEKKWRDEMHSGEDAVWEQASQRFLDQVRQDELASQGTVSAQRYEAGRAARLEQANALQERMQKRRRGPGGKNLEMVMLNLRRAQEVDDLEAKEEAERLAEMQRLLRPGPFHVRVGPMKVTTSARLESAAVADLAAGTVVNVLFIPKTDDGRVRGLIEEPLGWITLYQKSAKLFFAERVDQ